MALQRSEIVEIPAGSPIRPRGILANASPAPEGWEAGGIVASQLCPTIRIEHGCITFDAIDRKATRPDSVDFPAFVIEQSSGCSTISGSDRERQAREALDASTDYALGYALRVGDEGDRPSLSDATALTGPFTSATAALAALEGAASRDGKGQLYVVHATPSAAVHLANAGLITEAGLTPTGATLIVSSGYETDDGALTLWATGRVWAAAGQISTTEAVQRRTNNREAWATRAAIVGFNSCINISATFAPE